MTVTNRTVEHSDAAPGKSALGRFAAKFAVLKQAMPELWLVFVIKFLSIAAYKLTLLTIVVWLESDLGYKDTQAGPLVAAWSIIMSLVTLVVGSLTDDLGTRRTLFLGTSICLVARMVMVVTTSRWLVLSGGLALLAVGEALGGPVLVAAARRFSSTRLRSISFSMIYVMMNAGFWMGGALVDRIRHALGEHGHWNLAGMQISTYRTIFFASFIFEMAILPIIFLMREGAEMTEQGVKVTPVKKKPSDRNLFHSIGMTVSGAASQTALLFGRLVRQAGFYRLMAFLVLIAFIKLIYMQMDFVFSAFALREFGDGAPYGMLWSGANSMFIIVLVPIIGFFTQKYPAYPMVMVGAFISSSSIFIMALPPATFEPLARGALGNLIGHHWLGLTGEVNPYYVMITLFVLLLSVGEAFYSPRVYEYAAAIAPKGQEASYGALSYIPLLLAKILIGAFSGESLMKYCPPTGPRHPQTMWLIVASLSLVAPIGLVAFRRFIRVHEAGRDDRVSCQ